MKPLGFMKINTPWRNRICIIAPDVKSGYPDLLASVKYQLPA
jgi:hypothetical protein